MTVMSSDIDNIAHYAQIIQWGTDFFLHFPQGKKPLLPGQKGRENVLAGRTASCPDAGQLQGTEMKQQDGILAKMKRKDEKCK